MNDVAEAIQQCVCPNPLEMRGRILSLEEQLLQMPQVEIEPTHLFADRLYAREILIPAGTLLTGKIHNFSHINIISKGDISVATEDGIKRIKAPYTFIARAGTKRVGYAHEDTIWTTVHHCEETTPEEAEAALVVDSFEELDPKLLESIQLAIAGGDVCHS